MRPTGVGNSATVCDENCSFVDPLECSRVMCSERDLPANATMEEGVELVFPNTLQVSYTPNPNADTRNPKHGTRNPKHGTRNPETES